MASVAVKSQATQRFWRLFHELPQPVQRLAEKNYALWRSGPSHPSLHFRRLKGRDDMFTIRIGDHHRALAVLDGDTVTWVWIGTHADYDRMVHIA